MCKSALDLYKNITYFQGAMHYDNLKDAKVELDERELLVFVAHHTT